MSSQSTLYYSTNEFPAPEPEPTPLSMLIDPGPEFGPTHSRPALLSSPPLIEDSDCLMDSFDEDEGLETDSNPDPFNEGCELEPEPNPMPLPLEAMYALEKLLFDSIQEFAKQHGYAFRVGRSKTINSGRKKCFYYCDRCGPKPVKDRAQDDARRPHPRVRSTGTRKTGCEFSVSGVEVDGIWELRHRPDSKFSIHNHKPSHSAMAHPSHRRLNKSQVQKANELHNVGNIPVSKAILCY
jgi:hypothetical protein